MMIAMPGHANSSDVNPNATPYGAAWSLTDIGWFVYTDSTFTLTDISTTTSANLLPQSESVTLAVYSDLPDNGGIVLTSSTASYDPAGGVNVFNVNPITLNAGTPYFIAFENVNDTGLNVTQDAGAANQGIAYYDFGGQNFLTQINSGYELQPIIRFNATQTPEPNSTECVIAGMVLLFGLIQVKRHKMFNV